MKKVINFVIGKKDDKREKTNTNISVEITNPLGQKVPSEDEHIIGLQSVCGYDVDLSGRDKTITKLHKAAWQGNLDKIKMHLKKYDINSVDDYNRTPLHLAAAQGHNNIVCFLLNNNAIPDISDNDGMTPFLKAVECGIKECVATLLERGIFTSATENSGNTALHITAKQGFFNIMSMLLKNGAICDCANNSGEMPLHIATEQEHRDLVEILLQAGALVNVQDQANRTPLMLAARVGQASIVSLLLKFGANIHICDQNGWTAQDYALTGGHEQLALELKVPVTASSISVCNVVDGHPILHKNNEEVSENVFLGDEEAQDSPRSCETPPPLNPPRSWEIIQAGMIDQTQVRRRSLMALGTLESHRESFIENGNTKETHDVSILPSKNDKEPGRSGSDMEWDSDDSLPLDCSLPPPPEIPDSSLDSNLPLPEFILTPDSSLPFVPELIITPDRRSRITLERTLSLDLTDSDNVDHNKVSSDEILVRDGPILTTEVKWESDDSQKSSNINKKKQKEYANYNCEPGLSNLQIEENAKYQNIKEIVEGSKSNEIKTEVKRSIRESCSLDNLDEYSESKHSEVGSSQSCDRLDSERFSSGLTLDTDCITNEMELTQSLDSLEEESMAGTVVKRNFFHESHSLELLDEVKKKPLKQHSRNKSMSVSTCHWSKSVDVLSKPGKAESLSLDRKRIDAQLQCYDEALRELAEEQRVKQDLLNKALERELVTKCNLDEVVSCEIIEPRVIITQKSCPSPSLAETWSSKSIQGSSLDNTNYSSTSSEAYLLIHKTNSKNHLDTNCDYFENLSKINKNITPKLLENSIKTAEIKSADQQQISLIEYEESPSTSIYSSKPSTTEEDCLVDIKYKQNHVQCKQTLNSSVELPSHVIPKEKSGEINKVIGITDCKRTVSCFPDQQNDFNLSLVINSSKPPDKCNEIEENHKRKQCTKKFLKKEKSESHIKKRSTEKVGIKKRSRSVSLYDDQTHRKNIIYEGKSSKESCITEKSESDSDWSERPLQNKRKQFVAMRGAIADSDDSNDEDVHFPQSLDKGGFFTRQDTVIYNHHTSSQYQMNNNDGGNAGENDNGSSSSDSGSISISHSEASLPHSYTFYSNNILKEQLKNTVEENVHLEESVAKLKEQIETLQYKLTDANQSVAARDDKLVILQDEVTRLSTKYSAALDKYNSLKQQYMAAELELKHLKELIKISHEKEHKKADLNSHQLLRQLHDASKAKKRIEFEKEVLIAQHVMDLKKLQQDTIHWKNLYEDAISKLEQIQGQCDPCFVNDNQHVDNVQSVFKKLREGKISELCKLKDATNPNSTETKADTLGVDQIHQNNETSKDLTFDGTVIDNQVATLQLQLQQEKSRSSSLESQVKKLLLDLQDKIDLEAELENLNHRLEKEFVPIVELEHLRASQENAIGRIQQHALIKGDTKLNSKLAAINDVLNHQLQEQMQMKRQKELMETQMRQEFENTRQKLLLELSLVQATLKAKESEEIFLREKCESLEREVEKAQELKRRQLIEKSYYVNSVDPAINIQKQSCVKESIVPPPPPPPPLAPIPLDINQLSTNSLRQQLERTISKHKGIQLSVVAEDRLSSPPGRSQQ